MSEDHDHDTDTNLVVRPIRGKAIYCLDRDWTYGRFTVPEDFHTDGASIPRLLWTIMGGPTRPAFMEAAVLHDWHYNHTDKHGIGRKEADDIFYGLLKKNNVNFIRAWLMWLAVRTFGWMHWG